MRSRQQRQPRRGFTLIELLIVVAIIGIIAAIAIPNLLNSINRAKQKRTMADIRSLAMAFETYSVDTGHFPIVGPGAADAYTDMQGGRKAIDSMPFLVPTYIKSAVTQDGWGNTIWAGFDTTHMDIGVASWGKDGVNDGALVQEPTHDFNADIVFLDGQFVRFPEGVQQ